MTRMTSETMSVAAALTQAVKATMKVTWRSPELYPGPGDQRSNSRGSAGYDVISHRVYEYGDDFRSVDWKASGRTDGDLVVIQTREPRQIEINLLVDCNTSMQFGTVQLRTKQVVSQIVVASAILSADVTGDRIGLSAFARGLVCRHVAAASPKTVLSNAVLSAGYTVAPRSENAQSVSTWRAGFAKVWGRQQLTSKHEQREDGLIAAIKRVPTHRSLIFVLSDFASTGVDEWIALRRAGALHDIRCVIVNDPRERQLPDTRSAYVLRDMQTGRELVVDATARAQYAANYLAHQQNIHASLLDSHCQWVTLGTDTDRKTMNRELSRLFAGAGDRKPSKESQ